MQQVDLILNVHEEFYFTFFWQWTLQQALY